MSVRALPLLMLLTLPLPGAGDREEKVRADLAAFQNDPRWIYNDLPAAREQASTAGRPLCVVIRCVP